MRHSAEWDRLVVDHQASPERLDDARFEKWLRRQRVFVSSVMDPEMTPYRDALRAYLEKGGPEVPVMWETISPRPQGPVEAYLTGVDRSRLFILMLGASYGTADASGYSPTHREANRAGERELPLLLFTVPHDSSARDGKQNRWLNELYQVTSGNAATDPAGLVRTLDARLREMAAAAEQHWIKLGTCVFPGRVSQTSTASGGTFTVAARTSNPKVLRELRAMATGHHERQVSLTRSKDTDRVVAKSVGERSDYVDEAELEIVCESPQGWHNQAGGPQVTYINNVGPAEQAGIWVKKAIFGEQQRSSRHALDLVAAISAPDARALPSVLAEGGINGWAAEGVVRLYAVEEVARKWGGRFVKLEVGPNTSSGTRINGEFQLQDGEAVPVRGVVPLR